MPKDWEYGPIRFTERGFPDFNAHVHTYNGRKGDVEIKITGNRDADYRAADKELGLPPGYREREKLTWHHHEDKGRMQLIPTKLHKTVRHTGGFSMYRP